MSVTVFCVVLNYPCTYLNLKFNTLARSPWLMLDQPLFPDELSGLSFAHRMAKLQEKTRGYIYLVHNTWSQWSGGNCGSLIYFYWIQFQFSNYLRNPFVFLNMYLEKLNKPELIGYILRLVRLCFSGRKKHFMLEIKFLCQLKWSAITSVAVFM